jgi:hypothetical protein
MSESRNTYPLPSEPRTLDASIQTIPIPDLSFDTHSTSQEHATKEYGSFQEFQHYLKELGINLPSNIEEPFDHYLLVGPGRFYRAYGQPGDPMVAGLAMSPDKNGYRVDAAYSIGQNEIAAAAYRKILTRKFFGEFCGNPMINRTSHLKMPAKILTDDMGLARAVYEFGLVQGADFVIPMPGLVPFPYENMSYEGQKQARELIKERGVTGILPYSVEDESSWSCTEEFYKNGVFVGSVIETKEGLGSPRSSSFEAWNSDGRSVELQFVETDPGTENTVRRVSFLKTVAESDHSLASVILS